MTSQGPTRTINFLTKKTSLLFLITIVGLVSAILIVRNRYNSSKSISPKRGPIIEAIYALGRVKAKRQYNLKIGVMTTVEKLYVREGDPVRKNDPLVKLGESQVFRAPFDGTVTLLNLTEGETAMPSSTLLRIDDLEDKFVEVSLEQQGALRVRPGLRAEVVFESLRGEKLQAVVSNLYSKNDEFLANLKVEGLKDNVLPGMTADVAIVVGQHEEALLIPVRAIKNGFVMAKRKGKRIKIPVKIGAINNELAEIVESDLKETDQVILGGR